MENLPLAIPPGVFRRGTEFQSKGRAYDTNLVRSYGPSWGPGRVPLRIVPSDVDAVTLAALIRHENGHINGWSKDHPGGRF